MYTLTGSFSINLYLLNYIRRKMHNNKIIKTAIFIIIFLIVGIDTKAQRSGKEIDSISTLINKNYIKGDTNPSLTLKNATVLYYLSKEKKFYPGQIHSIFEEIKFHHTNGDFDLALKKISEGIDLAKAEEDYSMVCRILLLYQRVLLQLDHLSVAKQILEKAENYNKLVKNKEDQRINKIYIILSKADLLVINEDFDDRMVKEVIALKKQAYAGCLRINDSNKFKKVTVIYTLESLAGSLARFKKVDEARDYIDIVDQFLVSFPDDLLMIQNLMNKGIVENADQNYEAAIDYFMRAIMDGQQDHNRYKQYELYAMIADSYEKMKDFEHATLFSKKYKRVIDSIDLIKKKSGDIGFINKINLKISEKAEGKTEKIWNLFLVTVGSTFVMAITFFFYRKKNHGKKQLVYTPIEMVGQSLLTVPEIGALPEISNSNTKLEHTKELILLAKEDVNAFYLEFQKVYPTFYTFLKSKYHDLNISDINFCALVKMNFGIKEISQYTNSTIRAAEARRYRINKKMQLKNQNELYMLLSTIN